MSRGLTDSSVKSPWFQQNLKSAINLLQYARVQVVYTKSMYKFQEWKSWKIMTNLRKIFCRAGFFYFRVQEQTINQLGWFPPLCCYCKPTGGGLYFYDHTQKITRSDLDGVILIASYFFMPYIIYSKHEFWHINKTPYIASRKRRMQYRATFLVMAKQRPFRKLVIELSQ